MESPQIALGTSRLTTAGESPFEMGGDQWQGVQDYARSITAIDAKNLSLLSGSISVIMDLQSSCQKCKSTTFPAVIALAKETHDYATVTVPPAYAELKSVLDASDQGGESADATDRFAHIFAPLQMRSRALQSAATDLLPAVQNLVMNAQIASEQVAAAGGPGGVLSAIIAGLVKSGADAASVASYQGAIDQVAQVISQSAFALHEASDSAIVAALSKMEGGWGAIASDLGDLQQWISTQISLDQPFISELAVDAAVAEWADLASEAQAFIENSARIA